MVKGKTVRVLSEEHCIRLAAAARRRMQTDKGRSDAARGRASALANKITYVERSAKTLGISIDEFMGLRKRYQDYRQSLFRNNKRNPDRKPLPFHQWFARRQRNEAARRSPAPAIRSGDDHFR